MEYKELSCADIYGRLGAFIRENGLGTLFDGPRETMDRNRPAYRKVRNMLTPELAEGLELYIAACEEFCRTYAVAAHKLGWEEAFRAAETPDD